MSGAFMLDLGRYVQENKPDGLQFTGDANGANKLRRVDPAAMTTGASPNFGQPLLPHVMTFQGVVSSLANVYRPSDEALKDSAENARYMRNDLVVMECVEARQRATALLNWHVEPGDEKDGSQKAMAGTLTKIVASIPRFMQYRENLLHAVFFGRYGIANRWRWKNIAGGRRIAIDQWRPVHGDKLVWRYQPDDHRWDEDQVGVRVGIGYGAGSTIAGRWPVEKSNQVAATDQGLAYFLRTWERPLLSIHKHYIEDGEYEAPEYAGRIHGVGIRSRIYWTWYQKQETLAWLMEYLERSAGGFEVWFYPWGNDAAKQAVEKAARERLALGRNQILVPKFLDNDQFGQWYDRVEPSMAGAEALKAIIVEYFGHLLKRYILGQTLTSEASGTGLGSNLADVHLATFLQIIKYDATNLEETLTTDVLEPLIRFNFPWAVGIPFKIRVDTESENAHEKLEAYDKAFNMGLQLRAQDLYDLIGATKPGPDDQVLDKASQAPDPSMGGFGGLSALLGKGEGAGEEKGPSNVPPSDPAGEVSLLGKDKPGKPKSAGAEQYSLRSQVEGAAALTLPPTEAQREAGNYRKGKVRLHGLEVTIENAKGSQRRPEWPPLAAHYGYINRTEGRDGDHVDCYIGPKPESEIVFVVDQVTQGGRFDEHKCVLGCTTEAHARKLYLANYQSGWRCGPITSMTMPQFRTWLSAGDTTKPVAGQVSRYSASFDDEHPRGPDGRFVGKVAPGRRSISTESLKVRMRDLRIAEENLQAGKGSVTPGDPVEVSYNVDTGVYELVDGYHRYLKRRGGTIEAAKKSPHVTLEAIVNLVNNGGPMGTERDLTAAEIEKHLGGVSRYSALWREDEHPRAGHGLFASKGSGRKLPGLPALPERKTDFTSTGGSAEVAFAAAEKRTAGQYRSREGQQSLFASEDAKADSDHVSALEGAVSRGAISDEQASTAADWVRQHGSYPKWHTMAGRSLFDGGTDLIGRVDRGDESFAVHVKHDGDVSVYHWPGFGKHKKLKFSSTLIPLHQTKPLGGAAAAATKAPAREAMLFSAVHVPA